MQPMTCLRLVEHIAKLIEHLAQEPVGLIGRQLVVHELRQKYFLFFGNAHGTSPAR